MAIISVFVGSAREGRQGRKVADWVVRALEQRGHTVHRIDPLEHEELLVLRQTIKYQKHPSADMLRVRSWVASSDAFVAVSPEYNHSYSGVLKNALDQFYEEYHHKPFGIVTYSTSPFGGIRAAEHLRAVVAELGAPAIPKSLPVSKVGETFSPDGTLLDASYGPRLDAFLDALEWYAAAFTAQREKGLPNG